MTPLTTAPVADPPAAAAAPLSATGAPSLAQWLDRIDRRSARIGIIGLGYVGLPLVLLFSEQGFAVTGFDIDPHKVETLNAGRSYIHRIEPEHIAAAQRAGFRATTGFAAVRDCDAILICVPTPLLRDHTPDMSFVTSTIAAVAPHLRPGQLVVLESTTYPGTTEEIIAPAIEAAGNQVLRHPEPPGDSSHPAEPAAEDPSGPLAGVMVAFSPEREDPGNLSTPRHEIPKVLGGVDRCAARAAAALYGSIFDRTVPLSSPAAAEMTKLLENIYRSVNIALVNELKPLCAAMGIDIWEVVNAAATKPFGFQPFFPGPGVGGHCIPVDPFYLTWKAREFGFTTRFIELAGEINESMPHYVVRTAREALERGIPGHPGQPGLPGRELQGAKVLVLGVAYKRDVDDLRESPALVVIQLLQQAGAHVCYNDPFFPTIGSGRKYDLPLHSVPVDSGLPEHDLAQYDCVLILTDHSVYNFPDIVRRSRLLVDSRNATRSIESPEDRRKIVRC